MASAALPATAALLAIALGALPGCSGEDEVEHITHYYHPVWSPDGNRVVAALDDYSVSSGNATAPNGVSVDSPMPAPTLAIREMPSGAQAVYRRAGFGPDKRFWIGPGGAYLAALDNGVAFYTMNGGALGKHTPAFPVAAIAFIDSLGSFLWAGGANGRMVIGRVQSAGAPWVPAQETILKDSASTEAVSDIVTTSRSTFAVRRGAEVLEYNFSGGLLGRYTLAARNFSSPWQSRLHYATTFGRNLITLDDSGIVSIDLTSRTRRVITYGTVVNLDVNSLSGNMVYETTSGDIWLASVDGSPLVRVAPHCVMPSLSPDGKMLVAVSRIHANSDSLYFKKWIQ